MDRSGSVSFVYRSICVHRSVDHFRAAGLAVSKLYSTAFGLPLDYRGDLPNIDFCNTRLVHETRWRSTQATAREPKLSLGTRRVITIRCTRSRGPRGFWKQ